MKALYASLILLASIGCTQFQPIGPLAGAMKGKGSTAPPVEKDQGPPTPTIVSAPRPVPPAMLIVPEDVTSNNPNIAIQKLQDEFEYDAKMTPAAKTSEVSVVRGGGQ